ncbi:MAG: dockerin type I repeat-containing protein [Prevotella sp.]|nr:dockerin type I repeat-containing protein [Prevotella sp.]
MMKNIRLMMLMALLTIVGNASADELVISDLNIKAGETKTISIELNNPDNDYIAFEFSMRLPDGISIVTDENDLFVATINNKRSNDHVLDVSEPNNDGVYHFLCYSNGNKTIKEKSGEIISLTVQCADDAEAGNYTGEAYELIFSDPNFVEVDLADSSFGIKIIVPGDANGDGSVTIADAVAVVNYLLNDGSTDSNFVFEAADIDGSKTITAADALGIVNIIIGN